IPSQTCPASPRGARDLLRTAEISSSVARGLSRRSDCHSSGQPFQISGSACCRHFLRPAACAQTSCNRLRSNRVRRHRCKIALVLKGAVAAPRCCHPPGADEALQHALASREEHRKMCLSCQAAEKYADESSPPESVR